MKKYVMNKNVMHGGKMYANGVEIGEGDPGFKELVQSGHATVMTFRGEGEPVNESVVEVQPEVEAEMEEAPKRKGRKG